MDSLITVIVIIGFLYALRKIAKMLKEEGDVEEILTDPYTWLTYGIKKDWMRTYCSTHDRHLTPEEEDWFEAGDDPCVTIFRMVVDIDGANTSIPKGTW